MNPQRDAWRMPKAGSLARLTRVTEPLGPPGPGEAALRVEAIGLNFADLFACLGLYSATPKGAFVPGLECAGVVEALGPGGDARGLRVGDRVMAVTRFGGYATRLNLDARLLHPVPDGWSFAEAAAYPVQALTAWYALCVLGEVAPGDVVLVHSAAGGVGLHALEICARAGARAVATVGSEGKRDFLVEERGLAPAAVVVRDRRRFGAQLDAALAALGAPGFDLVLDAVMGPFFRPAFDRLRPEGRHLVFGAADFMTGGARPNLAALAWRWLRRPRVDPLAMISDNRAVMGFNLIWLWSEIDRLPGAYAALARLDGRRPHVGARLPFSRAPEALRLLQAGGTAGKVVLEVEAGAR
ncbi:MAG TPA: zinc-binding dehydrogenase [Anaeromyxobacteraceae bacterium]|nr:zinc-binding dehydrogenase [Anaeromyxobacteraceae bacterium]